MQPSSQSLQFLYEMAQNEAYLEYGQYQQIRNFVTSNIGLFQQGNIEKGDCGRMSMLVLVAAKALFMRSQYRECKELLEKYLPLASHKIPMPFKIVYQRQVLLLKAVFLFQPISIQSLQHIIEEYNAKKIKCCDWSDIEQNVWIYDEIVEGLWSNMKKRGRNGKNNGEEAQRQGQRQGLGQWRGLLGQWVKNMEKKCSIFQGIPVYLVSTRWLNKARLYASDPGNQSHPGPALQLELLNHLYQFERHVQENKEYMDTLLFPVIQGIDYTVLSPTQWKHTINILGGQPIKRFPTQDKIFSFHPQPKLQLQSQPHEQNDCLHKTIIQTDGQIFVFQWQAGLTWQYSILPYIRESLLGMGQMKELKKGVNAKKMGFVEERVVGAGAICGGKNRYRYTKIYGELPSKISVKLLKKLLLKYDLQPHKVLPDPQTHTLGLIGITNTQIWLQKLPSNSSFPFPLSTNQLNCILHCVGSLKQPLLLYSGNNFIAEIDQQWSQNEIEYVIGFGDWVKIMGYSDWRRDVVDCKGIIGLLVDSMVNRNKYASFAFPKYPFRQQSPLFSHLISLLAPLHHTQPLLPTVQHPTTLLYSQFEQMKTHSLPTLRKQNPLQVYSLFTQYHYQELGCPSCGSELGYKIVPTLGLPVTVKEESQGLGFYFVMPGAATMVGVGVNGSKGMQESQTDQLVSAKQMWETENTSSSVRIGKIVENIFIKLPLDSNMEDIYQILVDRFAISNKGSQLISVLVDEGALEYVQVYRSQVGKEKESKVGVPTVREVNKTLEEKEMNGDGKDRAWKLIVFLVYGLKNVGQQLSIISFRNPQNNKNKAFPQLISMAELKKSFTQGLNHKKNLETLRSLISNPKIEINHIQTVTKQKLQYKFGEGRIKNWLNIYTDSKIGASQKIARRLVFQSHSNGNRNSSDNINNNSNENGDGKIGLSLQQCIMKTYNNNTDTGLKSDQKVLCHKCKKQTKCNIKIKLLQFRKILIITLNRKSPTNQSHRIFTPITFPEILNPRDFLSSASSSSSSSSSSVNPTLKKKPMSNYILKSIVLFLSPLEQEMGSSMNNNNSDGKCRRRYGCVRRGNFQDGKWYLLENQSVKEIRLEDVDGGRVQMLIYERE